MFAIPEPHAPELRPRRDCKPLEPDEQLLLRNPPNRHLPAVYDADLLRTEAVRDLCWNETSEDRSSGTPQSGLGHQRDIIRIGRPPDLVRRQRFGRAGFAQYRV